MNGGHFDIIVVGSGFAGSLMAMIARRLGFSVALIERDRHPRFAIGESSTPLANLLLEDIAETYQLPGVRPLCKWGSWQKKLPQIGCGIKRGFTFYHHELETSFQPDPNLERQLLVGASVAEESADTHWYRPDLDQYLVEQAKSLGAEYFDQTALDSLIESEKSVQAGAFTADFLIDASGPRGFLHRALKLPEKELPLLPRTQALFSHFHNVEPLSKEFQTLDKTPPYPPEDAAVHHIFPGGWIWILKFNNGITSAGVAATDTLADKFRLHEGEIAWRRLLRKMPSLGKSFQNATPIMPFVHQRRIAFQSGRVCSARWAMLPSAAGVVDPLLSTGFPLTLLGVSRLARLLAEHWRKTSFRDALIEYGDSTTSELETTARLVGALYATMDRFETFKQLSLLYFAAAHYSETARRAGKFHLADSFLLSRDPNFSEQLRRICEAAKNGSTSVSDQVQKAIKPYDLLGLTDPSKGPWYSAIEPSQL